MVGYIAAASINNILHQKFGRRGVSFLGPASHLLGYIVISVHPPYPVLVIAFIFAGFGNGIVDAAWNAWIGNMANANELLGFLHGFYGLGATLSPLVATTLITKAARQWHQFYLYIMIPLSALELAACLASFWTDTGSAFRTTSTTPRPVDRTSGLMRAALRKRITWVCALFLFLYVGIEVALGGWIVTFMIRERDGGSFASGMVSTGFWLGITVGRVILGFVTPRIGEKVAVCVYVALGVGLELLFWLVPNFVVSAVAVAVLGFVLGPLFPAAVVATTRFLPAHLHIGAIGFAAAVGGSGACVLPFAVGGTYLLYLSLVMLVRPKVLTTSVCVVLAQAAGVAVLQPCILAMLAVTLVLWGFGVPNAGGKGKGEKVMKVFRGMLSRMKGVATI